MRNRSPSPWWLVVTAPLLALMTIAFLYLFATIDYHRVYPEPPSLTTVWKIFIQHGDSTKERNEQSPYFLTPDNIGDFDFLLPSGGSERFSLLGDKQIPHHPDWQMVRYDTRMENR